MGDLYGKKLTCTANDVSIANVTNITINDDGCQSPDDTVTFTATWDVQSTANQRYNVGLYFANDGQTDALNGTCSISTLPNSPVPPWFNFDNNECGDISSSSMVHPILTMTVKCADPNGDNVLNLPYCTSWEQNSSACTGPLNTVPGAPSKCNCDNGYQVPIVVPHEAEIEVIKSLSPATDAGRFDLLVDGVEKADNVGHNGTTGKVTVGAGTSEVPGATHTVSEAAAGTTVLADYSSSVTCVNRGTTTFHGGAALTAGGTGPLTVPVVKDDDIVCTFTNVRRMATLQVIKHVINDNGGTKVAGDFTLSVTGTSPVPASFSGAESPGTIVSLQPGPYSVSETTVGGYAVAYSADCSGTLAPGDTKTCTVTKDNHIGAIVIRGGVSGDSRFGDGISAGPDCRLILAIGFKWHRRAAVNSK